MRLLMPLMLLSLIAGINSATHAAEKLRVLIIDGQNNHQWPVTTPLMKQFFEESSRFTVDIATTPPAGHDMSTFEPKFTDYDVVVSNYNGEPWSEATEKAFQAYVYGGGGFVTVHAADNAFPDWQAYNDMIGLGGWNNRSEKSGPYVYLRDGKVVRDDTPGPGGHHGSEHEFAVKIVQPEHPIMQGLPLTWMHTKDELYEQLRGPAKDLEILATAFADPAQGGRGRDEPMLMVIPYGAGRVFHTVLGHADYSMQCVGFRTTLLRGTEWAATGAVTIPIPENFPGPDKPRPVE